MSADDASWFAEILQRLGPARDRSIVVPRALETLRLLNVKIRPGLLRGGERCRRGIALDLAVRERQQPLDRKALASECGAKLKEFENATKHVLRLVPELSRVDNVAVIAGQVFEGERLSRVVREARELAGNNASVPALAAKALSTAAHNAGFACEEEDLARAAGVPLSDLQRSLPSSSLKRQRENSTADNTVPTGEDEDVLKEDESEEDDDELSPPFAEWAREQLAAHLKIPDLPPLTSIEDIRSAFEKRLEREQGRRVRKVKV